MRIYIIGEADGLKPERAHMVKRHFHLRGNWRRGEDKASTKRPDPFGDGVCFQAPTISLTLGLVRLLMSVV